MKVGFNPTNGSTYQGQLPQNNKPAESKTETFANASFQNIGEALGKAALAGLSAGILTMSEMSTPLKLALTGLTFAALYLPENK